MRLATYNVEWFASLFSDDGALIRDNGWSGRRDITRAQQIDALGTVFREIDADAIMVIEAPDTSRSRDGAYALESFAQAFDLRTNRAIDGFTNHTQQEIALLYDPAKLDPRHDPKGMPTGPDGAEGAPRFDGHVRLDLDLDLTAELISWSKPPLELAVTTPQGAGFRIIGVHAKSKAPHGAQDAAEVMQLSIANRRKQLAQCIWLRRRVEAHLSDGDPLIVLGDFNDGPGLDTYEKLFGQSSVEVVMGLDGPGPMRLHDPHAEAALSQKLGTGYATSRFYVHDQGRYMNALLDYIMVSPGIAADAPRWHIWHPFDDPECWAAPDIRAALLAASDHFPVTLDFEPPKA